MTTRRLVFVPIFGDGDGGDDSAWLQLPHVKAWGFEEDSKFTPIHTDPPCESIPLGRETIMFDAEIKAMVDVPENSTDLPDEVCVALAKLALAPELSVREG